MGAIRPLLFCYNDVLIDFLFSHYRIAHHKQYAESVRLELT